MNSSAIRVGALTDCAPAQGGDSGKIWWKPARGFIDRVEVYVAFSRAPPAGRCVLRCRGIWPQTATLRHPLDHGRSPRSGHRRKAAAGSCGTRRRFESAAAHKQSPALIMPEKVASRRGRAARFRGLWGASEFAELVERSTAVQDGLGRLQARTFLLFLAG